MGYRGEAGDRCISDELVAQDAADALIAVGWPVRPADDDFDTWRIGFFIMTDDELINFALRWGIVPAAGMVQ